MFVPYIGITDFMSINQVERMLAVFNANLPLGQNRRLHVGVMMSQKTLNGLDTKWSKAFPPNEAIAKIFGESATFNCLHYADYESVDVAGNLAKAIAWGGPGMNALQLDMIWPSPSDIVSAFDQAGKKPQVILQVGKIAMIECLESPEAVAERLVTYKGVIDCVLLDKSMGSGLGMESAVLRQYVLAVKDVMPDLSIAVAGGLGPDSMDLVRPLVEEFPDISIDAQGRLRPSRSALDPIDWALAERYLINALNLWK